MCNAFISTHLPPRRLCMKHITIAIENMNKNGTVKEEENLSIIERIMKKTGNPKIAAVLALDLFLVGVDTVIHSNLCKNCCVWHIFECLMGFFFRLRFKTSVAATSTIYQLSQNPDKQAMLYKELKSIMPDVRSPVDTKILEQMPFLRACIKETLRCGGFFH